MCICEDENHCHRSLLSDLVLKAGGAYVPLDPAYPKQRLAEMLNDARVSLLITERGVLAPDQLAHALRFMGLGKGRAPGQSRAHQLLSLWREQDDREPALLRELGPSGFGVEGLQIAGMKGRRGCQHAERADDRFQLAIERRGVDSGRVQQTALDDRTVSRECLGHEDGGQHGAGQHGAQHEEEQIDAKRNDWRPHRNRGEA
jgi:hypothetical protein